MRRRGFFWAVFLLIIYFTAPFWGWRHSSFAPITVPDTTPAPSPTAEPAASQPYHAVWVSYLEWQQVDFSSAQAFSADIAAMFDNIADLGATVVLAQVRPFGDALYPSDYYPFSHLCTGTQGQGPGFDPLALLVQAAHARGIKAVERSVMLGYISRTHSQSIGVAGTHGKTTTTGMITTMLEHNSVLRPLYEMEERGAKLTIIKADKQGNFSLEDMEAAITPKTKAIVCTNGSNLTGNYVDVAAVGEMAHRHGVLLIVDASQTAGVFPIDVQKMNIDVLCFTGHKGLLAPQGTGGLYVREGLTVQPLLSGGSGVQTYNKKHPVEMPTALEAGTLNGHGIAGMNAALAYLEETGIDTIREREQELMWKFYEGVKDIPNVTVYGDFSTKNRCAIVALNIGDYDSAEVSDELLTEYGISTRPGGHCAPLAHEALGNVEQGAVRFSFSHYNTDEEIETAIRAIEELAQDEE